MCPSRSVSRLSRKHRIAYICIVCVNSSGGICVHDSQPIVIDKGSSVHGFIYRSVSGVALWQNASPLIRCRLGFYYLSFIFLYTRRRVRVRECVIFLLGEHINRFINKVPILQTERRSNGNHLPGKSTRTTGNPERS